MLSDHKASTLARILASVKIRDTGLYDSQEVCSLSGVGISVISAHLSYGERMPVSRDSSYMSIEGRFYFEGFI